MHQRECVRCKNFYAPDMRYCPHCGLQNPAPARSCKFCTLWSPAGAPRCYACGQPFEGYILQMTLQETVPFALGQADRYEEALQAHFYKELRTFVETNAPHVAYDRLLDLSYEKTFAQFFNRQTVLVADRLFELHSVQQAPALQDLRLVARYVHTMLVELLVLAGLKKITPTLPATLSECIKRPQAPALEELLANYLIDKSTETLIDWRPNGAIAAGSVGYYSAIPGESILAGVDFSANPAYARGLILTNMGLHWQQPLFKPQHVYYHAIKTLQLDDEWLNINGYDLDAGRLLNYRLLLFCHHVRLLFD